ncbi:hypothetical protein [Myxococcus virescens]|uniref:hypothetical protein n=1 Tax=Myxococcus virescens TaxID=83456 RepID=UPI00115FADB0|nr:hypothetical protein [Myxococcus virescens]
MYEQLRDAFHRQEPELVLTGYVADVAIFDMLDCDGYRVGAMRCLGVYVLCVTTRLESYGLLECYPRENLPDGLGWMKEGMPAGSSVFLFGLADEDSSSESVLPMVDGHRLAYVVCESVEFQAISGGR